MRGHVEQGHVDPTFYRSPAEALAPLLLLTSGALTLAAAHGRAWLAGTRDRLVRNRHRGAS